MPPFKTTDKTPATRTSQNNEATASSSSGVHNTNVNVLRQIMLTASTSSGPSTSTGASTSSGPGTSAATSSCDQQSGPSTSGLHFQYFSTVPRPYSAATPYNAMMQRLKRKRVKVESERSRQLPLPVNNSVSASLPLPPNWCEQMKDVSQSLATYKLFPLSSSSSEFQKLSQLLDTLIVRGVDRIVNPTVWTRFANAREEMLKAKCDDPMVLRELCLSDAEIAKRQQSINFFRHNAIDAAPYNENFALLFHCTRDRENLECILRDGFDERMGRGGLQGRGIYFSDNTEIALNYDGCDGVLFICGVLLGDCITINTAPDLVKEPEKLRAERRNIHDRFYDSVHGYTVNFFNKYVVYNRYQCCPLYMVTYFQKKEASIGYLHSTDIPKDEPPQPPFVWVSDKYHGQKSRNNSSWTFHAKTIFNEMQQVDSLNRSTSSTQEPIYEKLVLRMSLGDDAATNSETSDKNAFPTNVGVLSQGEHIAEPMELGNELAAKEMESEAESELSSLSSYHSSTDDDQPPREQRQRRRPMKTKTTKKQSPQVAPVQMEEDCLICFEKYASMSNDWKILSQCQHKLCVNCYKKIEMTRTTMAGSSHTFMKCPFCLKTRGIEIGICPNGEMREMFIPTHCSGYEEYGTIQLLYKVNTCAHRMSRVAYLPDNDEGRNVLSLLRIAWDRRITFTIGTSHTTGCDDSLVWNVHHKTSQRGGVSCHGYPDPTYLRRVRAELKSFEIV